MEHADFSLGPLRLGNVIEAIELNQVWRVTLEKYDASIEVKGSEAVAVNTQTTTTSTMKMALSSEQESDGPLLQAPGGEDSPDGEDEPDSFGFEAILILVVVCTSVSLAAAFLLVRAKATIRKQRAELEVIRREEQANMVRPISSEEATSNVVLGRPIEGSPAGGATHGEVLPVRGQNAKGTSASK